MIKGLRSTLRVWYVKRYWLPRSPILKDTLLVILCMCIWAWASNEDFKDQAGFNHELQQSYHTALTQCANGDCRFQWGNELFHLTGGNLGSAELVRSVK